MRSVHPCFWTRVNSFKSAELSVGFAIESSSINSRDGRFQVAVDLLAPLLCDNGRHVIETATVLTRFTNSARALLKGEQTQRDELPADCVSLPEIRQFEANFRAELQY
ncbi:MAG: hypothetical protein JWP89_3067 [Schlesneria sp.]|nr:hypothetical protein [Schlesneria sp.]